MELINMDRITIEVSVHGKDEVDSQKTVDIGYTRKGKLVAIVNEDAGGNILWVMLEEIEL